MNKLTLLFIINMMTLSMRTETKMAVTTALCCSDKIPLLDNLIIYFNYCLVDILFKKLSI